MKVTHMYQSYIRMLNETSTKAWEQSHVVNGQIKLSASGIGRCPRKTFLGIGLGDVDSKEPHSDQTLARFHAGHVWEEQVMRAIEHHEPALMTQVCVADDIWVGHIDVLVQDRIIEIKNTGYVSYELPRKAHVLQVLLQQELLGTDHEAWLFYIARNGYAEIKVEQDFDSVVYSGAIRGKPVGGSMDVNLAETKAKFEAYYPDRIPPRLATPIEMNMACCIKKRNTYHRNCEFFHYCWDKDETWQYNVRM